jgi:hypothetical protein
MMTFPIYGKNNQNVPNHQPVIYVDGPTILIGCMRLVGGFKPFQRCFEKYWMIKTKICVFKQKRCEITQQKLVCSRWKLDF